MNYTDLRRRLDRIEAGRGASAPTAILSSEPLPEPGEPDPLAGALANWREWVADGRAEVRSSVLYVGGPAMTAEAWQARFCTEH